MVSYQRDVQQTIPDSAIKVIGIGGAGINIIGRLAHDFKEGVKLSALNTDIRSLLITEVPERLQLGPELTRGLATGGDPELGERAVLEVENQIRESISGYKMVFICTGLGGGTGSGGTPIVARIARELGAFVVVFATVPFSFEGRRRAEQAEAALSQLAVLSNAMIVFDNDRMGDLVLANQGVHRAFEAADTMISESIRGIIRLANCPGLIRLGLDDLVTALRTQRSRCLFGSGTASGPDRAQKALRAALESPLLDKGKLLHATQSVLVHICGGETLSLSEIELLMAELAKTVPDSAHILFGAAVDKNMEDSVSLTLISALPEEDLASTRSTRPFERKPLSVPSPFVAPIPMPTTAPVANLAPQSEPIPTPAWASTLQHPSQFAPRPMPAVVAEKEAPKQIEPIKEEPVIFPAPERIVPLEKEEPFIPEKRDFSIDVPEKKIPEIPPVATKIEEDEIPDFSVSKTPTEALDKEPLAFSEIKTPLEKPMPGTTFAEESAVASKEKPASKAQMPDLVEELTIADISVTGRSKTKLPEPRSTRDAGMTRSSSAEVLRLSTPDEATEKRRFELEKRLDNEEGASEFLGEEKAKKIGQSNDIPKPSWQEELEENEREVARLQAMLRAAKGKTPDSPQQELEFSGGPRGRFEAETPNFFDGEDLDVPAFLRKSNGKKQNKNS